MSLFSNYVLRSIGVSSSRLVSPMFIGQILDVQPITRLCTPAPHCEQKSWPNLEPESILSFNDFMHSIQQNYI